MFGRKFYSSILLAVAVAIGGAGCASSKKKQSAAAETVPPAAAYPAGEAPPAGEGANSGTVPPPHNYGNAATSSKPQPFQLRADEQLVVYQIGSGDTLGAIAKKYRTTPSRIMAANGMTSDRIIAGKTIQIPTVSSGGLSNSPAPSPANPVVVPSPASTPGYAATQTPSSPAPVLKPLPYGGTTTPASPAGNTTPGYVGPADSTGLPSVSSSGSARKTNPIPPVTPVPKPKPVTSGSAFPTPSFSSGN